MECSKIYKIIKRYLVSDLTFLVYNLKCARSKKHNIFDTINTQAKVSSLTGSIRECSGKTGSVNIGSENWQNVRVCSLLWGLSGKPGMIRTKGAPSIDRFLCSFFWPWNLLWSPGEIAGEKPLPLRPEGRAQYRDICLYRRTIRQKEGTALIFSFFFFLKSPLKGNPRVLPSCTRGMARGFFCQKTNLLRNAPFFPKKRLEWVYSAKG